MDVCPAKTWISLGIRPVWSESSLCAQWVAKDPSFLHVDSEVSDQIGRIPRLIWVFTGRTLILLVLTCHGSFTVVNQLLSLDLYLWSLFLWNFKLIICVLFYINYVYANLNENVKIKSIPTKLKISQILVNLQYHFREQTLEHFVNNSWKFVGKTNLILTICGSQKMISNGKIFHRGREWD